ncbi:NAD(P)/FAD-dependent oxidoreductase [Longimicrobium sp.]|uniref:NAD(P)/FAD-dependent oxidoreductase n=1 Tax=Longimicrobium sp. TaxID=2029185 RepID=UPI002C512FF3|nr:NAD(P)/FAD-dependent oxidoreductase [Longimicrobium sp.]HSU15654.1 NAD(P)/FAD-dependent oxidoreductase [Longimicrobium sp.]
MPDEEREYDAIVIGGGPAGLAAAMWLARYRRSVRLFDAQDPRNKETWAVHGYFGIDDPPPLELRRIGRQQATGAGAELEAAVVKTVEGAIDDFRVTIADDRVFRSRRLVLATGLKDIKPEVAGFDDFYGTSIWHCPECDGPTIAGKKVGILGWGESIAKYALYFLTWTDDLTVLTHSHPKDMSDEALKTLGEYGIGVNQKAITALEGTDGRLERVVFHDGTSEEFPFLFFHVASGPGSTFPLDMGCEMDDEGIVQVDNNFQTSIPGVYAAGDITPGTRLAIRAAFEGTRAAIGVHKSLIPEEEKVTQERSA